MSGFVISGGITEVNQATFEYYCHRNGLDPANFTRDNLIDLKKD